MMQLTVLTTTFVCLLLLIIPLLHGVASSESSSSRSSSKSNNNNKDDEEEQDGGGFSQLVAWIKQNGGRVADGDSFQIQQMNDGIRGGVATMDIVKGTELLYCPWNLIINGAVSATSNQMTENEMCDIVQRIDHELHLGTASNWYWYLKLHHSDIIKTRLTSFWNDVSLQQLQGLPPQEDSNRHVQWLLQECGVLLAAPGVGSSEQQQQQEQLFASEFMQEALILFLTRATAVGMVPIYDLFNHHNGYRNAKLEILPSGIQLIALQDIPTGNQIYISYGIKSTSTMFRDYGFIEKWPQLWTWTDNNNNSNQNRHTLALLDNAAVIYPTREFLQEFWYRSNATTTDVGNKKDISLLSSSSTSSSSSTPLLSFQQLGIHHNTQFLSQNELDIFEIAARNLLDSLPTTVLEDFVILAEMKKNRQQQQQLLLTQNNRNNNNNKTLSWIQQLLRHTILRFLPNTKKDNDNKKTPPPQVVVTTPAMIMEQSDSIIAVEYRIKFKQAVQIGLDTALQLLQQKQSDDSQHTTSSSSSSSRSSGVHNEL